MAHSIGYIDCNLESRDSVIRRSETNFGNFMADLMRTEYYCDFGMCNSGTFRKNSIIPEGEISLMALYESFPFNDSIVVLKCKGSIIKEALEWAVSAYPSEDGRFMQVSNISFMFNPNAEVGNRLDLWDIATDAGLLDLDRHYTVAMPVFMANGGDGYSMFKKPEVETVVDEENAQRIIGIAKNFFKNLQVDYEVNPKRELARQIRMKDFNVDQEVGISPCDRFYRIQPEKEDRIHDKEQEIPMGLMRKLTSMRTQI